MFARLRRTLGPKETERELAADRESSHPLNHHEKSDIVSAIDGTPQMADVEAQVGGLTKVPEFAQILGSIVLDCGLHQLPRSATTKPLHWAVRHQNNAILQKLLENKKWRWNVEAVATGEKGERPLHVAAEVNNLQAFRILIEHGANPHCRQIEYYGLQPVQIAASKGSIDVLKFLTTVLVSHEGQDFISSTDLEGSTALHWAVLGGEIKCIQHLLEHGAAVDWIPFKGTKATPLHFACIEASLEIVQLMAHIRPDEFRRALHIADIQGCTPLHRAVVLDRKELVEFLLDKGAPINSEDNEGRTPIILAAIREAWSSTEVLVKWGVNPFLCNRLDLRHVGHHAAMVGADPRPCRAFGEMFIKHPEWRKKLNSVDSFGYTPLQYAAGYGHVAAFHGLLAMGASITSRSEKDKTVLHYAAKYGQLEMVKTLLALPAGISVLNAMDHKGRSALHVAASYGHHDVVELLLSKGSFSFRDDSGRTAFHYAASKNHHLIMGSIATYFSLVLDEADKDGNTALHLAAINDAGESIQYLLAIGAVASNEDIFGRTPMDMAIYDKNEKAALAFVNSSQWKDIVIQSSREYGSVVLGLVAHLPEVMKRCLDRCLEVSESNRPEECYIAYDFSILHPLKPSENTQHRHYVPMRAMKAMATLGRSELLAHPVCTALLERKWITYGMYCSGLIMLSNLVFVSLLSYIMMTTVQTDLRPHLLRKSYNNVLLHSPESLKSSAFAELHQRAFHSQVNSFRDNTSLVVLGLALVIIFFKELAELRSEGYRYFMEWMNYMEIMLFLSCGGFVFCFFQDDRDQTIGPYTYQFGAVAIFLAWFNLLRFFRPFGTFGIYSFMFFCILKTLIKVSFFFFLLTAAFTGAFSTLFQSLVFPNNTDFYKRQTDLNPMNIRTAHGSVTNSALRIGAMTVGDLESLENFINPLMDGMLEYPLLSFIVYVIFLMLMPILLNNLLTGLAIGDMAAIQANAASLRLEMQVHLHESLEKLFPTKLLKKFHKMNQSHRTYPGVRVDFRTWLARWLQSGGIRQPVVRGNLSEIEENNILSGSSLEKEDLGKMHRRLKQLDEALSEQRNMLSQVLGRLEKITPTDETDQAVVFASSIVEKARKRSERIEEDRKHAARLQMSKRKIANNLSAKF